MPGDTEPQYGVAAGVSAAAIVATAQAASATVSYSGTDAISNTTAHDISLSDGANTVTITVTDKGESAEYTLSVNRAVTDGYGWKADSDFDTLKLNGIRTPRGIWSDGTEVWVLDTDDSKVYAYNTDGTRKRSSEDFSISAFSNGIWGDGTTLWAASSGSDKLFAYGLATGASDSGKDFDTLDAAGNESPRGVWSDETTMWVSDSQDDKKIYAYKMSDMSRDSGKDFDTLDAAGNDDPRGIWSDETTMWVADGDDGKVYAYKMSDKSRDSGKDFDTLDDAGNDDPKGMWSDGTTMWVTDDDDDKVYAYNLRSSVPAQAPTGLTATALGATIVDLTWTAPADNGGSDDHRLQGRGLGRRHLGELVRPRRQYREHERLVSPYRALRRRDPALPGLGDQRAGHVGPLQHRRRHHHGRPTLRRAVHRKRRRSPERGDDRGKPDCGSVGLCWWTSGPRGALAKHIRPWRDQNRNRTVRRLFGIACGAVRLRSWRR